MSNNKHLRIPKRLVQRPQWRNLPIPYIALIRPDGQPDFRVTDEAKRISVIRHRLCQLCGDQLGRWFFFVGGVNSFKSNAYFEPACHLDCLIYAMQVCPFIVGKMDHHPTDKIKADNPHELIVEHAGFSDKREPLFVIVKANGWTLVQHEGAILLQPHKVKATEPLQPDSMTWAQWKQVMNELSK